MEFIEEIKILENTYQNAALYILSEGTTPVLITNIKNSESNGLDEQYIRAIARYVAANTFSTYLINTKDSIIDLEKLKSMLSSLLASNKIKLIINLCNTATSEYDVTYQIVNRKELDYAATKELGESFKEAGIIKNTCNFASENFFEDNNIDVIQIGINTNCRDLNNPEKLKKVCTALINYIKMYTNYTY